MDIIKEFIQRMAIYCRNINFNKLFFALLSTGRANTINDFIFIQSLSSRMYFYVRK